MLRAAFLIDASLCARHARATHTVHVSSYHTSRANDAVTNASRKSSLISVYKWYIIVNVTGACIKGCERGACHTRTRPPLPPLRCRAVR
jgi:hypothetical protein